MRSALIVLVLVVVVAVAGLFVAQQKLIHDVEPDISFRFDRYVFDETTFPSGDFTNGRMVHRVLFPTKYTVTFYDAQGNEVKTADKPGRYGAVVRMYLGFRKHEVDRFITLYRTAANVYWEEAYLPMTLQLPAEIGLDPAVVQNQQAEISRMIGDTFIGQGDTSPAQAILLAGLSEMGPTDPPVTVLNNATARDNDWWYTLRQKIGLAPEYRHLLDLPAGYDADPNKKWPLVIFISTGAENGDDLARERHSGIAFEIGQGRQVPAIVLSPQCDIYQTWNMRMLKALVDETEAKYRVDPDRIYVTGGRSAWDYAVAFPDQVAAMMVVEGDATYPHIELVKGIPTWLFHNLTDAEYSTDKAHAMVDAMRAAGGHIHVSEFPFKGDIWDPAYHTDALYTWLFAQKRGQPEVLTPGVPTP